MSLPTKRVMRGARVRLDVRRIYPIEELSSRYEKEQRAGAQPDRQRTRRPTLIDRLRRCMRWFT